MIVLSQKELYEIQGGGISLGVAALIGAGIVFVVSLIDGFVHPKKCG